MSFCILDRREAIAYCEGGKCVPLVAHSANVLSLMLGVERLRAPVEASALAFNSTLPNKLGAGWYPIIVAGAVLAGAFHDIGKACAEHTARCSLNEPVSFFGHEILGSALLLAAANRACAYGDWNPGASLVLASYATLMHHHAMAGRGSDLLTPRKRPLLRGHSCSPALFDFYSRIEDVVKGYAMTYYLEHYDTVNDALSYVFGVVEMTHGIGSIELLRAAEAIMAADPTKAERKLFGRAKRCDARVVSVVTRSLFGRSPDPVYGGLIRRAGISIVGSLSVADTLAASMEGRGGASAFSKRIVRELLGD